MRSSSRLLEESAITTMPFSKVTVMLSVSLGEGQDARSSAGAR